MFIITITQPQPDAVEPQIDTNTSIVINIILNTSMSFLPYAQSKSTESGQFFKICLGCLTIFLIFLNKSTKCKVYQNGGHRFYLICWNFAVLKEFGEFQENFQKFQDQDFPDVAFTPPPTAMVLR